MPEDHPAEDLLTKEQIARELNPTEPLSIRSVERYIKLANDAAGSKGEKIVPAVKGSGRGKQAKFRRADVDKIKAAYQAAASQREQTQQPGTALTRTSPAGAVALAELIQSNAAGFDALRAALDPWPVWMTRAEALERTGVPPTWFDAGVRKELLPHVGNGRARRFHRDDVRAFAGNIRAPEFRTELLKQPAQLSAANSG